MNIPDDTIVTNRAVMEAMRLLAEHQLEAADYCKRNITDLDAETTIIRKTLKRWTPIAEAESGTHRPHQIACGVLLNRWKQLAECIPNN